MPARLPRRVHARGRGGRRTPGAGRRARGPQRPVDDPDGQPPDPGLHLQEGQAPPRAGLQPAPGADAADPHRAEGIGQFRPASWDEALDLVGATDSREALADDPATVVPYLYNSSAGRCRPARSSRLFWRELGASAVHHTICAATAGQAWDLTFGSMPGADLLDVVHAQLVVVWGANPAISNTHLPPLVNQARQARRRAGRGRSPAHGDGHAAPTCTWRCVPAPTSCWPWRSPPSSIAAGWSTASSPTPTPSGVDEYLAACAEWTLDRAAATCDVSSRPTSAPSSTCWAGAGRRSGGRDGGSSATATAGRPMRAVLALPVLTGAFGQLGSGVHLHTDHDLSTGTPARCCDAVLGPDDERSRHGTGAAPAATRGEPEPARPAAHRPG